MALGVEFVSVIARKQSVADAFPGGLDAFAAEQPNYTEDEHLLRVGLMSTAEADTVVGQLFDLGVGVDDVTVLASAQETPRWLCKGTVDGWRAVWLAASEPGPLVPPIHGWLHRGPTFLLEEVRRLADTGQIAVRRLADGATNFDETWEISRGRAVVEVRIVDGIGRVGVWVARRTERRSTCIEDIELGEWLAAHLKDSRATD